MEQQPVVEDHHELPLLCVEENICRCGHLLESLNSQSMWTAFFYGGWLNIAGRLLNPEGSLDDNGVKFSTWIANNCGIDVDQARQHLVFYEQHHRDPSICEVLAGITAIFEETSKDSIPNLERQSNVSLEDCIANLKECESLFQVISRHLMCANFTFGRWLLLAKTILTPTSSSNDETLDFCMWVQSRLGFPYDVAQQVMLCCTCNLTMDQRQITRAEEPGIVNAAGTAGEIRRADETRSGDETVRAEENGREHRAGRGTDADEDGRAEKSGIGEKTCKTANIEINHDTGKAVEINRADEAGSADGTRRAGEIGGSDGTGTAGEAGECEQIRRTDGTRNEEETELAAESRRTDKAGRAEDSGRIDETGGEETKRRDGTRQHHDTGTLDDTERPKETGGADETGRADEIGREPETREKGETGRRVEETSKAEEMRTRGVDETGRLDGNGKTCENQGVDETDGEDESGSIYIVSANETGSPDENGSKDENEVIYISTDETSSADESEGTYETRSTCGHVNEGESLDGTRSTDETESAYEEQSPSETSSSHHLKSIRQVGDSLALSSSSKDLYPFSPILEQERSYGNLDRASMKTHPEMAVSSDLGSQDATSVKRDTTLSRDYKMSPSYLKQKGQEGLRLTQREDASRDDNTDEERNMKRKSRFDRFSSERSQSPIDSTVEDSATCTIDLESTRKEERLSQLHDTSAFPSPVRKSDTGSMKEAAISNRCGMLPARDRTVHTSLNSRNCDHLSTHDKSQRDVRDIYHFDSQISLNFKTSWHETDRDSRDPYSGDYPMHTSTMRDFERSRSDFERRRSVPSKYDINCNERDLLLHADERCQAHVVQRMEPFPFDIDSRSRMEIQSESASHFSETRGIMPFNDGLPASLDQREDRSLDFQDSVCHLTDTNGLNREYRRQESLPRGDHGFEEPLNSPMHRLELRLGPRRESCYILDQESDLHGEEIKSGANRPSRWTFDETERRHTGHLPGQNLDNQQSTTLFRYSGTSSAADLRPLAHASIDTGNACRIETLTQYTSPSYKECEDLSVSDKFGGRLGPKPSTITSSCSEYLQHNAGFQMNPSTAPIPNLELSAVEDNPEQNPERVQPEYAPTSGSEILNVITDAVRGKRKRNRKGRNRQRGVQNRGQMNKQIRQFRGGRMGKRMGGIRGVRRGGKRGRIIKGMAGRQRGRERGGKLRYATASRLTGGRTKEVDGIDEQDAVIYHPPVETDLDSPDKEKPEYSFDGPQIVEDNAL